MTKDELRALIEEAMIERANAKLKRLGVEHEEFSLDSLNEMQREDLTEARDFITDAVWPHVVNDSVTEPSAG